uniref:hypothetical protein n=1 Tax=Candidatus Electrothrix sp. TaxID=2170559 RepID=UPI004057C744
MKKLEEIALMAQEHLLPEIEESVEACMSSYRSDEFNDLWTFATNFWRNTWNRLKAVSDLADCPFDYEGGNRYKLKIDQYRIGCHRINTKSRIPAGAKALKKKAPVQLPPVLARLGCPQEQPFLIDNVVIAVDADPQKGLREVFLGELVRIYNSKKFVFKNIIPIFLAENEEMTTEQYSYILTPSFTSYAPEEELSEIPLGLYENDIEEKKTSGESGS